MKKRSENSGSMVLSNTLTLFTLLDFWPFNWPGVLFFCMVTVKEKAVLRLSKANSTDRVFYTTDGTEPTTSSPEWTSGDVTVYGHTRVKTLTQDGLPYTYSSTPVVFICLPEVQLNVTGGFSRYEFQVPEVLANYPGLKVTTWDSSGNFISTTNLPSSGTASIYIDVSGTYTFEIWSDTTFPSGQKFQTPAIEMSCRDPVISYTQDLDSGTATVTITKEGQGEVHYTLDGSDPSETNGTLYTSSFVLTASTLVRAINTRTGWTSSAFVEQLVPVQREVYILVGEGNIVLGSGNVVLGKRELVTL